MNTTRKTIWTARLIAALSAVASYMWTGLLYDFFLSIGSSRTVTAAFGIAVTIILADMYSRLVIDYRHRIAFLAAAYGVGAATLAVLVAPWL